VPTGGGTTAAPMDSEGAESGVAVGPGDPALAAAPIDTDALCCAWKPEVEFPVLRNWVDDVRCAEC
jgi:hypothetical protein